jgi:hypothetical protein
LNRRRAYSDNEDGIVALAKTFNSVFEIGCPWHADGFPDVRGACPATLIHTQPAGVPFRSANVGHLLLAGRERLWRQDVSAVRSIRFRSQIRLGRSEYRVREER